MSLLPDGHPADRAPILLAFCESPESRDESPEPERIADLDLSVVSGPLQQTTDHGLLATDN